MQSRASNQRNYWLSESGVRYSGGIGGSGICNDGCRIVHEIEGKWVSYWSIVRFLELLWGTIVVSGVVFGSLV